MIDEVNSQIAVRWSSVGVNKLNYLGVGPTNKFTKITVIEIIEVENYKIIKRWGEGDISDHLKNKL